MKPGHDTEVRISETAAQWLGTLLESKDQQAAFFNWLAESPRHVDEFMSTLVLAQDIAELTPEQQARIECMAADVTHRYGAGAPAANVVPLEVHTASAKPWTRKYLPTSLAGRGAHKRRAWVTGIAAGVLALIATGIFVQTMDRQVYATTVGEQRVLELKDGSVVHLNTQSRLEVRYTAQSRTLRLLDGQALFKVQHDAARPFFVESGNTTIQALGTQFDVYRRPTGTHVAVIEGLVQVLAADAERTTASSTIESERNSPHAPQRLAAGEGINVATNGTLSLRAPVDLVQTTAWQQRRLVFREETLGNIAAEFNRYNTALRIRVVGSAANNEHFSGTFDADAPETLMQTLMGDDTLMVHKTEREIIVRAR